MLSTFNRDIFDDTYLTSGFCCTELILKRVLKLYTSHCHLLNLFHSIQPETYGFSFMKFYWLLKHIWYVRNCGYKVPQISFLLEVPEWQNPHFYKEDC